MGRLSPLLTDRGPRDGRRCGESRCAGGRAGDLDERAPTKAFHALSFPAVSAAVVNAVGADSPESLDRFDRLNRPGSAREYRTR
jgi:hypothetical protein